MVPFFYISAAHRSSGKTTLSIGLAHALRTLDMRVQTFKKGPDYIDPLWLGMASGRPCFNLDFNTQQPEEIQTLFGLQMVDADVGLIEGNLGLHEGMALDGSDSNAAMSKLLKAPVVLVIDARGVTRGVAPLLQGYCAFDKEVQIAGVIFNQVGAARQEARLRQVVEHYTDLPVLGCVARNPEMVIEERHLGLVPGNEDEQAERRIELLGRMVAEQVDLTSLLHLTSSENRVGAGQPFESPVIAQSRVRLGVARDSAFGFYYPDDLLALQQAGAELRYFSPIHDQSLPEVDGLFLGGGFPETHATQLEANLAMRSAIAAFIEADGPVYAECGGMMYLCQNLVWRDERHAMVGVIPADAVMYAKPQGRGLMRMVEREVHPWGGTASAAEISVHEFHYSRLENLRGAFRYAYDVRRGQGIDGQHDGLIYRNLLAGYAHHRDVATHRWARRFVDFIACHAASHR